MAHPHFLGKRLLRPMRLCGQNRQSRRISNALVFARMVVAHLSPSPGPSMPFTFGVSCPVPRALVTIWK